MYKIKSKRLCGLKQQNNLKELKAVVDVRPLSYTTQRHPTHCTKSVRQGIYIHQSVQKITNEARYIQTPNLLIWSQTRCRCAIAP